MATDTAVLHLVCGKIAAGKSTRTTALAAAPATVLVGEDYWLARLYPGEQNSLEDYLRNAGRLRTAIAPHLIELLRQGLSVVLDFPANTPESRAWMRSLFDAARCEHQLHFLDVPEELCRARLRQRNASGSHEFHVSDEIFALFSSHFVPPSSEEGFHVIVHGP